MASSLFTISFFNVTVLWQIEMGVVFTLLLLLGLQVRISTIDGNEQQAMLIGVDSAGLAIERDGKPMSIPFDSVLAVTAENPEAGSPPMRVELANGSRLAVSGMSTNGSALVLSLPKQATFSVPLSQVRWARFRPASLAVDPQWFGLLESEASSDVLVVRRAGNALDEVQGIVKSITSDKVIIDLDGDELPAPLDKLEGIRFAKSNQSNEAGKFIVLDTNNSRWQVLAIESAPSDSERVVLKLGQGLSHELPLSQLQKIETTGSVILFAKEAPAASRFASVSQWGLADKLASEWFATQVEGDRDLILRADSTTEYRIDSSYSSVQGSVTFDPAVTAGGKCSIKIWLDDTLAWEQTLDVEEPSSRGFDLPVGNARRLRFEVSSAGDGDVGDLLRIRNPRLVK